MCSSDLFPSHDRGGVINIITKKQKRDGANLSFQSMYGSYNTLETQATGGIKQGRQNGNAGIGYNRSDGHRKNMNFEQLTGYVRGGYDLSDNWKTSVDLDLSKSLASNPGTVEIPLNDNDGDIIRGMTSLAVENEYENTSGGLRIYYNFGEHKINDGYREGVTPSVLS